MFNSLGECCHCQSRPSRETAWATALRIVGFLETWALRRRTERWKNGKVVGPLHNDSVSPRRR